MVQCGPGGILTATLTWQELWAGILGVRQSLAAAGVTSGTKAGLWCRNRLEWLQLDIALQLCGGIGVPVYTTLAAEEAVYILEHSECELLFLDSMEQYQKIKPLRQRLTRMKEIVFLASDAPKREADDRWNLRCWREFAASLEAPVSDQDGERKFLDQVDPASVVTVIYTSGTTGFPKGVLLTHKNFLSNLKGVAKGLPIFSNDRHLSFLPLSHVFERLCGHYLLAYAGGCIGYARSFETVAEDAKAFKPTFLMAVPRFYEKFQATVSEGVQKKGGLALKLFDLAAEYGQTAFLKNSSGSSGPAKNLFHRCLGRAAHAMVKRKLKSAFGGEIRFLVSGGAPLGKEIGEYFTRLGLLVIEGYGLTETSPVITMNRLDHYRIGSVGAPIEGVEVRISPEGEIQTRGASVMKGYFKDPAATDAAIKDGWFCTGDLGTQDAEGFVAITGRIKEIIVLSGGKKLSPRLIEERMESQPGIRRCVVYGDGKNFVTALVVAAEEGPQGEIRDPEIRARVQEQVNAVNAHFAPFEQIKYFVILAGDFSVENGELTPTLKLRRKIISQKYGPLLEPFYKKSCF